MRRVYRPTLAGRVLFGLLSAAFALLGLVGVAVASFGDGTSAERIAIFVPAALFVAFGCLLLFFLRVRVVADDRGVDVVNYLSRQGFGWDEIDRFEVGFAYLGISLVPLRAAPIKVNAIQKTNLYHWLKKRGRADRIVDELNELLAQRRPVPVPPPP
jgi:hypothetical protein